MKNLNYKDLKHVYLLNGAETYYIDRGLEDILKKLFKTPEDRNEGLIKLDCDKKVDINEIISAIDTAPFFSDKNVILVKNANLFKSKTSDEEKSTGKKDTSMERLINSISNMIETNYVIFTTKDTADKRKKIYKAISKVGIILDAEPLRAWTIDNWLNFTLKMLHKKFDSSARQYFMEVISMLPEISLYYLENELKKVSLYVEGETITKKDLQLMMAELPEVSSFALIDAVTEKNLQKSMYLLQSQMNEKKEPVIIALLVRNIRLLMRAKFYMRQGIRGKALAAPLSLNPYIAQKTGEASNKFSAEVLEEAFLMLAEADYNFKFGKFGSEMLERIIIKLISKNS